MTRRRRRRGQAKCGTCRQPIVWKRWVGGGWRSFEPKVADPRSGASSAPAYPTEDTWAWRFRDLVEDLMVRRRCGQQEAEDEAYAMTWRVPHQCPPGYRKGDAHDQREVS